MHHLLEKDIKYIRRYIKCMHHNVYGGLQTVGYEIDGQVDIV